MNKGIATYRVYTFEDEVKLGPWLERDRPIGVLRRLANRVFRAEGVKPYRIVAHQGVWYSGQYLSYAYSTGVIRLARNQRNIKILLHEIAHGLGHWDHLPEFIRCYLGLLIQYGKADPGLLMASAEQYKLLEE